MNEDLNVSPPNKGGVTSEGSVSVYSRDEVIIGTWLNGESIYRKVFEITSPTTTNKTNIVDCSSLNIDKIISMKAVITIGGVTYTIDNSYINTDQMMYLQYSKYTGYISQKLSHTQLLGQSETIIIEYIKAESQPTINKITTISGRTIYRHPNNMGSVIEFMMYNQPISLFVADSNYWEYKMFNSSTDWGMTNCPGSFNLTSKTVRTDMNLNALPACTDNDIETIIDSVATGNDKYDFAKNLCNYALSKINNNYTQAINYTRTLTLIDSPGMDVPNIFELMVITYEADYLQTLDPSYNESNQYYIGWNNIKGKRMNLKKSLISCNASSKNVNGVAASVIINKDSNNLIINGIAPSNAVYDIIPVKELGI